MLLKHIYYAFLMLQVLMECAPISDLVNELHAMMPT